LVENKKVVVVGIPGVGKTTIVKKLAEIIINSDKEPITSEKIEALIELDKQNNGIFGRAGKLRAILNQAKELTLESIETHEYKR